MKSFVSYTQVQNMTLDTLSKDHDQLLCYGPQYVMNHSFSNEYDRHKYTYVNTPWICMLMDCSQIINLYTILTNNKFEVVREMVMQILKEIDNSMTSTSDALCRSMTMDCIQTLRNLLRDVQINTHAHDTDLFTPKDQIMLFSQAYVINLEGKCVFDRFGIMNKNLYDYYRETVLRGRDYIKSIIEKLLLYNLEDILLHIDYAIKYSYNEFDEEIHDNVFPDKKEKLPSELLRLMVNPTRGKTAILYYALVYTYLVVETKEDIDYILNTLDAYALKSPDNKINIEAAVEAAMKFSMPDESILQRMIWERG